MGFSITALHSLAAFCLFVASAFADQPSVPVWNDVTLPFRPINITANGDALWVCGTNEMIVASSDGGRTWNVKHQNPDGDVLLNIAFVDEKVGHAAGTGGLLLSTSDGGQTWTNQVLEATVRQFSFADSRNGIVQLGRATPSLLGYHDQPGTPSIVRITHDGGDHWADAPTRDEKFHQFPDVLSVVALDPANYLMALHQPQGEHIFASTRDSGKTWTAKHLEDVYVSTVFPHAGEYWGFGIQILERKKGGGYSAPVVVRSKDALAWAQALHGPKEWSSCVSQGCHIWDGTIEMLYGPREKFVALPQNNSLTARWALALNRVCTVGDLVRCASADYGDKPQPKPAPPAIISVGNDGAGFSEECLDCKTERIAPDQLNGFTANQIVASISIQRDGSVAKVTLDHVPNQRMGDAISQQLSKWLFEPAHNEKGITIESHKVVPITLLCTSIPGVPQMSGCTLTQFTKHGGGEAIPDTPKP